MKFAVTAVIWWKKYTEDEHKHLNCIWFSIIGSGFWAKWIESNGLRNWLPYIFLFVVNFASIFSSSSFYTWKTCRYIDNIWHFIDRKTYLLLWIWLWAQENMRRVFFLRNRGPFLVFKGKTLKYGATFSIKTVSFPFYQFSYHIAFVLLPSNQLKSV